MTETPGAQRSGDSADGVAEAVQDLTEQTRNLASRQLRAAIDETVGKAKQNMPAGGLLALSAILGLCAAASGYRLSLRLLEKRLGPAGAAMAALALYGSGAAAAAAAAVRWLQSAPVPAPTQTVQRASEAVSEANQADRAKQAGDRSASG